MYSETTVFTTAGLTEAWKWEETQDRLKLTMQRDIFGLHMPVRQMMERKLVASVC